MEVRGDPNCPIAVFVAFRRGSYAYVTMPMPTPLFGATDVALERITELYDFLWPAAVGFWNLRWQVKGFNQQVEEAPESVLQARFVEGSGIIGANLRKACLRTKWNEQLEQLGHVALVNIFAIHESWCSELVEEIMSKSSRELTEGLQYPSCELRGKENKHFKYVLKALTGEPSHAMKLYENAFRSQRLVMPGHVDELLTIYRCFKECRNSIAHNGGRASWRACEAAKKAEDLKSNQSLPFTIPPLPKVKSDEPVELSLYSVVGFSDLVRRLMLTIDALNCGSIHAEKTFVDKWKRQIGITTLKANSEKRQQQLQRYLKALRLPKASMPALEALYKVLCSCNRPRTDV